MARISAAPEQEFHQRHILAARGRVPHGIGAEVPFLGGHRHVRFLDTTPTATQFAILSVHENDIVHSSCMMECDIGGVLRWNAKKRAFGWIKSGHDD